MRLKQRRKLDGKKEIKKKKTTKIVISATVEYAFDIHRAIHLHGIAHSRARSTLTNMVKTCAYICSVWIHGTCLEFMN